MLNVVSTKSRGDASMSAKNGAIKLVAGNSNPALAREIAARLGVSLAKVKTDIFRGREVLRRKLRLELEEEPG